MKKLLIVITYYDGDADMATELCRLIADLETTRCHTADILLYRRFDAHPLSNETKNLLLNRFDKVHELKCRRLNAVGYPCGANELWSDLIEQLRNPAWKDNYYAFVNLESDCIPTRPGWINAIGKEFMEASMAGYSAIGHINAEPIRHLNGAAIYDTDFFNKAGGMNLLGGPNSVAYDFYHASRILPVSKDTPLVYLDFNRKTITADDLFNTRKFGQQPAIYHGVKDMSAMTAVRSRYVDKGKTQRDISSKTVISYYPRRPDAGSEEETIIDLWKKVWLSQGWNPIITNEFDAGKHHSYATIKGILDAFKVTNKIDAGIMKWLSLDYHGGGLYANLDTFPMLGFSPEQLWRDVGFIAYHEEPKLLKNTPVLSMFSADRNSIQLIIDQITSFDFAKAKNHIDTSIASSDFIRTKPVVGNIGESLSNKSVISFNEASCATYCPGAPRSSAIKRYFETIIQ